MDATICCATTYVPPTWCLFLLPEKNIRVGTKYLSESSVQSHTCLLFILHELHPCRSCIVHIVAPHRWNWKPQVLFCQRFGPPRPSRGTIKYPNKFITSTKELRQSFLLYACSFVYSPEWCKNVNPGCSKNWMLSCDDCWEKVGGIFVKLVFFS